MQETVESEMKSWADIVKKTNNTQRKNLTENSVKQAARLVNEEERQSKNLMIYDCPEKVGEEAWGRGVITLRLRGTSRWDLICLKQLLTYTVWGRKNLAK